MESPAPREKSFVKYFLKRSIHGGLSLIFQRNFALISILGIVLQYYISLSTQSKTSSISFWIDGVWKILASGIVYLIVRHYRYLYCVIKMLPRDIRGTWRFTSFFLSVKQAGRKNMTIAKIFDTNAKKHPNKICFYFEDEKWTFKQIQNLSNQIGNYFSSKGFRKGDTVALFMENRPEFVCVWMGLNKIGVCAALVNYNLRLQPLLHCIEIVKAKAVIFGHELSDAMKEVTEVENFLSTLPLYCSGHKGQPIIKGVFDFDTEVKTASTSTPKFLESMKLNDNLYYIYTSGTTGLPKAAVIKQFRFMMAASGIHYMNLVTENDIFYDSLPLYHMTGGLIGTGQALLFGTSVVIRKRFSASQFWKDCIKYNVTVAQYLGETLRYLLAQPPTPEEKLHKVRLLSGNGLRHEIWQDVVDRFNVKEIGEVYGSTEGNCNVSNIDSKVGAVGFVPLLAYPLMPMALVKIDEMTGDPIRDSKTGLLIRCKPNEPGELVGKIIKHHPVRDFQGYTDDASTSKKILQNAFRTGDYAFRTNDILVMDEYGYLFFKDRTGDTFRWKGENVSTAEVESIIGTCCSYKDAVVYGVKVPNTEGRAGMVAIADFEDNSANLEALANTLTKSLPSYARPLFLRMLEKMDVTGTYKFRKVRFQEEGYDVNKIKDKMYFFSGGKFVSLDKDLYDKINSGKIRL